MGDAARVIRVTHIRALLHRSCRVANDNFYRQYNLLKIVGSFGLDAFEQ